MEKKKFEFGERVKLFLRHYHVIQMIKEVEGEWEQLTEDLSKHIVERIEKASWYPQNIRFDNHWAPDIYFTKTSWPNPKGDIIALGIENFKDWGPQSNSRPHIGIYLPLENVEICKEVQKVLEDEANKIGYKAKKWWPVCKELEFQSGDENADGFVNLVLEEFKWLFSKVDEIDKILKKAGVLKIK